MNLRSSRTFKKQFRTRLYKNCRTCKRARTYMSAHTNELEETTVQCGVVFFNFQESKVKHVDYNLGYL